MTKKRRRRKPAGIPKYAFSIEASSRFAKRVIDETGVDAVVIGRFAVWGWVADIKRHAATKDLDLAVQHSEYPYVDAWVNRSGLFCRPLSIGGINVMHGASGVNVDFIDRSSATMGDFSGLFSEAVRQSVAEGYELEWEGVTLTVVVPEYLVAMKMATGEPDDERDVRALVLSEDADVDVDEVRDIIRRWVPGALGRFEHVLRVAGHPDAHLSVESQG